MSAHAYLASFDEIACAREYTVDLEINWCIIEPTLNKGIMGARYGSKKSTQKIDLEPVFGVNFF